MRWTIFIFIALLGLALRLPQLSARPMHTDEAVNAYIVGQVLSHKSFTYDSKDRHGPALAAFALPLVRMEGAKTFADLTESGLRLTDVLAGTVTILLFGVAAEMFGFVPCFIAALLFALAPLPVYYDRYFIHESLFVAASFAMILSGWRAWKQNSATQGALAGGCAALMLACKETAVLQFFALAAAALCCWWLTPRSANVRGTERRRTAIAAVGAFLLLSAVLFSWFGSNWNSLITLLHAVPNLLARAGGEGHQQPLWYYPRLLAGGWSGGMICGLACLGLIQAARVRDDSSRNFLVFYGLFVGAVYCLIPYKTPWLALNLFLPLALFAGLGLESLWQMSGIAPVLRISGTVLAGAVLALAIAHDTRDRVFVHPADENNPYAYAHTSEDLLGLSPEIEQLAREDAIAAPRVAVIATDPWPLPWYLRHFPQIGFWQPGQQVGDADFYITDAEPAERYESRLKNFHADFFGVRPGVLVLLWSPLPK